MGLFSKPEYIEVVLPFVFDNNAEDEYACLLNIEAFGYILGERKYCFASFDAGVRYYDDLAALLTEADEKLVKVIAKVKNGVVKDFKIDLNDLAERLKDQRFAKLSLSSWGIYDSSSINSSITNSLEGNIKK